MTKRYAHTAQVNSALFSRQILSSKTRRSLPFSRGGVRLFVWTEGEVVPFE